MSSFYKASRRADTLWKISRGFRGGELADCGRMKAWNHADKPLPSVLSFIPARGVGIVTSGGDAGNDRWNLVRLNFRQQLL